MRNLYYFTNNLDEHSRLKHHLTSELQMEHAAIAIYNHINQNIKRDSTVLIVCGSGNNGADGYALARLLTQNYKVKVLSHEEPKSALAMLQYNRLKNMDIDFCKLAGNADVVVDAIFGSGLSKPLSAKTVGLLQKLNALNAYKIACDIPTGIFQDGTTDTVTFKADTTITMGAEKLCLYSDFAKDFCGNIEIANLGTSYNNFCKDFKPDALLLETEDLQLPYRKTKNTNKGDFGFVSVISGNKSGASTLAAMSAIKFGAGLVGIFGQENIMSPEIIKLESIPKNSAVVAGCGLGKLTDETLNILISTKKAVIDADIFYDAKILKLLEKPFIFTPHPKEFANLLAITSFGDVSVDEVQKNRFKLAKEFTQKFSNITLILKGANTIISQNGEIYIMPFGSQKLSKGGSGDVLCGMLASLLAQEYDNLDAAISATITHALAAEKFSGANYALTPLDIINNLASF